MSSVLVQMSFADGSERRSTKQESAWLFRIWYNFDHKYPLKRARTVVIQLLCFLLLLNERLSSLLVRAGVHILSQQRELKLYIKN